MPEFGDGDGADAIVGWQKYQKQDVDGCVAC